MSSLFFDLKKRDRDTGSISVTRTTLDARSTGIVVVDLWNFHWCKTSSERVAALVPRMNKCLEIARSIGMTVFLCPTDVADNYVGTPQYETPLVATRYPAPDLPDPVYPTPADGGGCTCGASMENRCQGNFGWDGMNPNLVIADRDWIVDDRQLLYSLCREKGLTHLIYMGVHTQACLLGKSIGMLGMLKAGIPCILARDLTDAHGKYDPFNGITPDDFTGDIVAHFEQYLCTSVNLVDTWRAAGLWDDSWVVDPVRVTPWGVPDRPHLFEKPIVVTLTAPWQPDAVIRYTLDGSAPTPLSARYQEPMAVADTTHLRVAAFDGDRPVCLPSEGYFARLGNHPPEPDVHLSDLPFKAFGPGHTHNGKVRWTPHINPPQLDQTNRRQKLRMRNRMYDRGIGTHAPNALTYALKPSYSRFVALAGVDEYIVDQERGSNLARYPSVRFRVFIDGQLMAESPVMRILEEPWRFDVAIPTGSREIRLVAMEGGNGNREDLANWVNAGFVTKA
ncbi:MAG: NPCBM/NEW2 domain-containing protein [candidate division Zixibacteria bacterium]|nr:NPCBM/NEW2 domain-containing protein [candidate division Zixibacteria bacterium]